MQVSRASVARARAEARAIARLGQTLAETEEIGRSGAAQRRHGVKEQLLGNPCRLSAAAKERLGGVPILLVDLGGAKRTDIPSDQARRVRHHRTMGACGIERRMQSTPTPAAIETTS